MAEMEGNKKTNKLLRYIGCIQNSEQSLDYIDCEEASFGPDMRAFILSILGRHLCRNAYLAQ